MEKWVRLIMLTIVLTNNFKYKILKQTFDSTLYCNTFSIKKLKKKQISQSQTIYQTNWIEITDKHSLCVTSYIVYGKGLFKH
jgi:hypothetical protein